jgi:hypothetical protein
MSFNIRYYNTNDTGDKILGDPYDCFIPMIEDQKPTVICIQEARPPQFEVVGRELERLWIYRQGRLPTMPTMMSLFLIFYR